MDQLIAPHGGVLKQLIVDAKRAAALKAEAKGLPSWDLTPRQLCDLELLQSGAFSPLEGFMTRADYERVCTGMRLADGTLWPMPIVLDLPEERAKALGKGARLALRDPEGVMLAVLTVKEVWEPDRKAEAQHVFGTINEEHPGVRALLRDARPWYAGGTLEGVQAPEHFDYRTLRETPAQVRADFARMGWRRVIAFQTRNPMHRAHHELTLQAIKEVEASLLIHPVVGMTKPGDVDHYTRVRCIQALLPHYPAHSVKLSLLPLAMRMGGPREAIWHAIIRKNHGCTHFIVGRDHAGPGSDSKGKPFYGPYEAQEALLANEEEIGVKVVPFQVMVYVKSHALYMPADRVPKGEETLDISGTELRNRLAKGLEIPEWFTYPEVARELRRTYPPRDQQGFTVFFTGLSGSGKSTIAKALLDMLMEIGDRPVTLLDGDLVRKHLSSELGFSKEHRDINIRRIGYVASEITKNGGIALCAPIAPYDAVRQEVRRMIAPHGGFVLVHVSTPIGVCEERDRKGLYAKARAGLIKEFTGVSDPYEAPQDAEVAIDTTDMTPEESAQKILLRLESEGYIGAARTEA